MNSILLNHSFENYPVPNALEVVRGHRASAVWGTAAVNWNDAGVSDGTDAISLKFSTHWLMKWTWVELETRLTFVLIGEPIELGISQSTSSGLLSGCLEKVLLFSGNLPHSNLSTVQCQSGDLYWCCIHPTSLLPLECLSQGEGENIYWAHSMDLKKSESSTAAWKSSGVCPWGNWCNNSTLFHIDISKVSGWFSVVFWVWLMMFVFDVLLFIFVATTPPQFPSVMCWTQGSSPTSPLCSWSNISRFKLYHNSSQSIFLDNKLSQPLIGSNITWDFHCSKVATGVFRVDLG